MGITEELNELVTWQPQTKAKVIKSRNCMQCCGNNKAASVEGHK